MMPSPTTPTVPLALAALMFLILLTLGRYARAHASMPICATETSTHWQPKFRVLTLAKINARQIHARRSPRVRAHGCRDGGAARRSRLSGQRLESLGREGAAARVVRRKDRADAGGGPGRGRDEHHQLP